MMVVNEDNTDRFLFSLDDLSDVLIDTYSYYIGKYQLTEIQQPTIMHLGHSALNAFHWY